MIPFRCGDGACLVPVAVAWRVFSFLMMMIRMLALRQSGVAVSLRYLMAEARRVELRVRELAALGLGVTALVPGVL